MYGNNNSSNSNNNGGYPPYGYSNKSRQPSFSPSSRSYSGGRLFGMSHSLPSGMDTEFSSAYPSSSSRRGYSDMPGGGIGIGSGGSGSANSLTGGAGGTICNVPPTASNNSLNCLSAGMDNNSGGGGGSVGSNSGGSTGDYEEPAAGRTNLIINYLPQDMTDRELYALFRTVGPINTCRIMRDYKVSKTGYSFGYAFVDFNTEMDAQRAIKTLNGISVRNKRLKVSFARPGGEAIKDTNLYVTNLPRTITEDKLDTIFSKYGNIVQKNILRDKLTGKPRGVAFVRYNKREEAQEAISSLNNVIPEGGSQPLSVRLAEEHGKAKAAHFMNQMAMGPLGPPPPPQANFHMNGPSGSQHANMMAGLVHRGENFSELLDGLYRKKALQFQY